MLPHRHSDHSPLLIHYGRQDRLVLRFSFQAMWILHPDIRGVISRSWESPMVNLYPIQFMGAKLKRLRTELRTWTHFSFGFLDQNLSKASSELQSIQSQLSNSGIT